MASPLQIVAPDPSPGGDPTDACAVPGTVGTYTDEELAGRSIDLVVSPRTAPGTSGHVGRATASGGWQGGP